MKYIQDKTGRFPERPHYELDELDRECENAISKYFRSKNSSLNLPISTNDLTNFVETYVEDLDIYADLSAYGPTIEGVTEFRTGGKPSVFIDKRLSQHDSSQNRFRTTLSHEWGHVHFHAYLWRMYPPSISRLGQQPDFRRIISSNNTIYHPNKFDWLEWQASYASGAVLMPKSHVIRLVSEFKNNHDILGAIRTSSDHGQTLIAKVASTSEVSCDAARVRLAKLNVLTTAAAQASLFN